MKYGLLNTTDLIIQLEMSWEKISGTRSLERRKDLKTSMIAIEFVAE